MEAIAAGIALLEHAPWKRQQLCHPRLRAVEAVVEASDLRQCRMQLGQRLDGRQVVGKVQRKERDELFGRGHLGRYRLHGGEDCDLRLGDADSVRQLNRVLHDVRLFLQCRQEMLMAASVTIIGRA